MNNREIEAIYDALDARADYHIARQRLSASMEKAAEAFVEFGVALAIATGKVKTPNVPGIKHIANKGEQ